jgi:starch synthase
LRYGTLPIVRATGGLDDTIDEGVGFKFAGYSGHELMGAVHDALAAWDGRDRWTAMVKRAMRRDFSWHVSAREYGKLYESLHPALGRGA